MNNRYSGKSNDFPLKGIIQDNEKRNFQKKLSDLKKLKNLIENKVKNLKKEKENE